MKIIITGGTGFVGDGLVKELHEQGHEIKCLSREKRDNDNYKYIKGDIIEPKSYEKELLEFRPDKVIHLAWYGLPSYTLENCKLNYNATMELFKIIAKAKVGSSRVDLQACKLEYSIVSPK